MPEIPVTTSRRRRTAAERGTETALGRTRRARRMARALAQAFPEVWCELDFTTPLELAVATILSAQCTDARVNQVTPALFARYRTAADYANADREELEQLIHSTGFYRNKARSIQGLGAALVADHDGVLPHTMAELVKLPGFGRKTANVVLGNAFDTPGLTVDTHFQRLTRRWRWTELDDPVKIEHAVAALLPRKTWTDTSHRIIWFGRRVCHSRKPACGACFLRADCPSAGEFGPLDPVAAAKLVTGDNRVELLALAGLDEDGHFLPPEPAPTAITDAADLASDTADPVSDAAATPDAADPAGGPSSEGEA